MYRYQVFAPLRPIDRPGAQRVRLVLSLDVDDPTEDAALLLEGPEKERLAFQERLVNSYGFRGRPMSLKTSFQDLQSALKDELFKLYDIKLLE